VPLKQHPGKIGAAQGEGGPAREGGRSAADDGRTPLACAPYLQVKLLSILVDWFEFDGLRRCSARAEALLARPVSSRYIWHQGAASVGGGFFILAENWRSRQNGGSAFNRPEVPGQGA
jgi:hypothetical protein